MPAVPAVPSIRSIRREFFRGVRNKGMRGENDSSGTGIADPGEETTVRPTAVRLGRQGVCHAA